MHLTTARKWAYTLDATVLVVLAPTVICGCTQELEPAARSDQATHAHAATQDRETDLVSVSNETLSEYGISCLLRSAGDRSAPQVTMTLTNEGPDPIWFLPRGTAWDSAQSIFVVSRGREQAPYIGAFAHRDPPDRDEYLRIGSGERAEATYALARNHRVVAPGKYDVALRRHTISIEIAGRTMNVAHGCQATTVDMSVLDSAPADEAIQAVRTALTYDASCSSSQQAVVEAAKSTSRFIYNAYSSNVSVSDLFYRQWFGNWSSTRGDIVATTFAEMDDAWDTWTIKCHVGTLCADGANAWVSPGSPTVINLCNPWFSLPPVAYEASSNKAGVLVHEASHLLGGTDDEVYGADNARALAATQPDEAVDCAENYEHFATNLLVSRIVASIKWF